MLQIKNASRKAYYKFKMQVGRNVMKFKIQVGRHITKFNNAS